MHLSGRRSLWSLLCAGMLVLALTLSACGGDDEESSGAAAGGDEAAQQAEPASLTLGLIPIVDVAPIFLGMEKGFFEEENLTIETQFAAGGAAIVPAVLGGDFEVGFSNNVSLIIASTEGLPTQIIAPGVSAGDDLENDYCGVYSAEDSGIIEPEDLAGKKIAINTLKNIGDVTIKEALSKQGVDQSTVTFVEVPFPDMVSTLESGDVDAVWVCEPFSSAADAAGANFVLGNYVGTAPDLAIASYFVNGQWADENPEVLDRFVRALTRSLEYAATNPEEVRRVVTDYAKVPGETAAEMSLPVWDTEVNRESISLLAELSEKYGLIEEQPDLDQLIR